jgi:hypothetical protein
MPNRIVNAPAPILRFLGAAGTVTGSKFILTAGDRRVLVDCGLFQGLKQLRLMNWESSRPRAAMRRRAGHSILALRSKGSTESWTRRDDARCLRRRLGGETLPLDKPE